MADLFGVGEVVATALSLASKVVQATVNELVKDSYKVLKTKIKEQTGIDADVLGTGSLQEEDKAAVAEAVNRLPTQEKEELFKQATQVERQMAAIETDILRAIGIDIKQLTTKNLRVGSIEVVSEGTGMRVSNTHVLGEFQVERIHLGPNQGKH